MNPFLETKRNQQQNFEIIEQFHLNCFPHYHQLIEVIFILEGEGQISINGTTKSVRQGDIAISDSYEIHMYTQTSQTAHTKIVMIPSVYFSAFSSFKRNKSLSSNFLIGSPCFDFLISLLNTLKEDKKNDLYLQGVCNILLGTLTNELNLTLDKQTENNDIVRKLIEFIDENSSIDLNLDLIAKHFSYSKSHFSRLFNNYFNCKLNDYINNVRINKIIYQASENSNLKLNAIIIENGYSNPQTFYRIFKDKYGMTPLEYINSLNNK